MANGIGASLTNYQSNMLREHNRAMDLIPDKASLRRRETRFCGAETNCDLTAASNAHIYGN